MFSGKWLNFKEPWKASDGQSSVLVELTPKSEGKG